MGIVSAAGRIWRAVRALGFLLALLTPIAGVWVASSLAAHDNGPTWLVCLCGLLLFPGLPLLWEAYAAHRRKKKTRSGAELRARRFSPLWRLAIRTLVINLLFLTALLSAWPREGFVALNVSGDWMLGRAQGKGAVTARRLLFAMAGGLQWLYEAAAGENPHLNYGDLPTPSPNDAGGKVLSWGPGYMVGEAPPWPMPARLHPAVAAMDRSKEESIKAVGRHLARMEPDPFLLVKALHDWTADRIYYDHPSLADESWRGRQDAERVFRTRTVVCSGYSRLLAALGRAAGAEIYWIGGKARGRDGSLEGNNHSWNTARIKGRWYLMDPTWNSPRSRDRKRKRTYRTEYLFTPPELFVLRHFPKRPEWQLLQQPLSRGEMLRQPWLTPRFYARGYSLPEPLPSQVGIQAGQAVTIKLSNRAGHHLFASLKPREDGARGKCSVDQGPNVEISCRAPGPGRFRLTFYDAGKKGDRGRRLGKVEVLVR